ncbi:MAG: ABC transporter ATP-binding protein/permease [Bdellovibrionaceae bacterium]|nr:ABC transporter ATP-binding protein/permease [Pseudobdellovibrionaceae bacterium]
MEKNKFLRSEDTFEGKFKKNVYATVWMMYRPWAAWILFYIILGFVGRALVLANANVIGWWVDSLCQGPSCRDVPQAFSGWTSRDYLHLLAAMAGAGFLITAAYRIGFSRLSARAVSAFYDEVTARTSRYPMSFFDRTPTGRITTRFSSDYANLFRFFGGPLAEFLSIIIDLILMIALITVASPWFLAAVALSAAANAFIYKVNEEKLRSLRRQASAARSPSIAHFSETTQGASTIRSFGKVGVFRDRFERLDGNFVAQRIQAFKGLAFFSSQMGAVSALLLLGTGLSSLILLEHGWISIGDIGVAFGFIALSGNTIQVFFEWLAQADEALVGVERLDAYLRRPIEKGALLPSWTIYPTDHPKATPDQEKLWKTQKITTARAASLEVRDLTFSYAPDLPTIFNNFSFKVNPGEKVGIVGRTGSGKSSLVQTIFHLYESQAGDVLIDDKSAKPKGDIDLEVFRRSIAFIPQDPVLFQGTLRENLDLMVEHSDAELLEALHRVGLSSWFQQNPLGLQRPIEERGKNLSLGERQLLCMARALLQDAPIVIMDEATSSVDPQSEEILVAATEKFFAGRTQIIIAHRPSTLQHCNRIIHLGARPLTNQ